MINIDIAVDSAKETFDVVVKSADDGSKAGFTIMGAMSEEFSKARRALDLQGIRAARVRKGKIDWEGNEGDELIADQKAAANMIIAQHCTVGWFGFYVGKEDPQPFEFSPVNLTKVLNLFPMYAERITLEVQNDENFMPSK